MSYKINVLIHLADGLYEYNFASNFKGSTTTAYILGVVLLKLCCILLYGRKQHQNRSIISVRSHLAYVSNERKEHVFKKGTCLPPPLHLSLLRSKLLRSEVTNPEDSAHWSIKCFITTNFEVNLIYPAVRLSYLRKSREQISVIIDKLKTRSSLKTRNYFFGLLCDL